MTSSYFALGYKCNHSCSICPLTTVDRLHASFSREKVLNQLDAIGFGRGDHVTISGGEPTLVPYLLELISILACKGVQMTLLTNCSGFADDLEFAKALDTVGGEYISVTTALHAVNPEIHDAITRVAGSFDRSITGIHNLVSVGIHVTVKHIICALTYLELHELARFVITEFPNRVDVLYTSMDYSGRASKNKGELFASFAQTQDSWENAMDLLICNSFPFGILESPLCSCDPCYWKYFSLHSRSLRAYIAPNATSKENIDFNTAGNCRSDYPPCQNCDVMHYCTGVWRSAYEIGGDTLLRPIKLIPLRDKEE